MEEETIAVHFENNELAEISQAITHYKMSSYYYGESDELNNGEEKINKALCDLMINEMEREENSQ
ncbi:hypothetical protein [Enterococcus sp. 5H]|uniref:hypothetical protein n=1 Tax=Enterococcus sp. 5H TaxID=1229490 RepID=UPI00230419A7|nr:hypothetical protein [Enterococcus sp. 5H]MDA9469882.1 hypothetical protein [Enterococcus sp. 5H]